MKLAENNTPEGGKTLKSPPETDEAQPPGMKPSKIRAYHILFADFENGLRDIGTDNPDNINAFEILGAFDFIGNMIKGSLLKEQPVSVYDQLQKSLGLTQINGNNNYTDSEGNNYKLTKFGFKPTSIIKRLI